MSIFIDLEMNTTDTRLVHRKELKNEVIEIGAAADQPAGTRDGGLKTRGYPKQISTAACCSLQGSMTKKILRIKLLLTMLIRPNIVRKY